MKRFFSSLSLLFVLLTTAHGQGIAVQKKAIGAITYPRPVAVYVTPMASTIQGNTLVAIIFPAPVSVSDSQSNAWTPVPNTYAWITNSAGGPETITVTYSQSQYYEAIYAEYPGQLSVDVATKEVSGSGLTGTSNSITATANDTVIGYGFNNTTNYDGVSAVAPFTLEAASDAIFFEDLMTSTTGPISSSGTWSSAVNWIQGVIALKPAVPPAPNVTLTINTTAPNISSAIFDNNTPILTGPIAVAQIQNPTTTIGIGTIMSDQNGNLSGTLVVNPNWVDSNGNLNFAFGLPILPNVVVFPFPVAEFQHNSTGLTINLVVFKQGSLGVKLQTLGLTP
jgi:hypothetical protein